MTEQHIVAEGDDDIRLDRWFKRHYPGVPHGLIEKQLRKGQIRLDGKKAKSSDRVRVGQAILCPPIEKPEIKPKRTATEREQAEIKKWVLYRDERVIIVNKPPGLAVQGGSKVEKHLDGMLGGLMEEGDKERPKLVHRIDRDTSGCVVLARTAKVASALMPLFAARKVDKTYLALVNSLPEHMRGTIDLPLAKKDNPKASGFASGPEGRDYEIVGVHDDGQKAITEFRVIDQLARKFSVIELKPLTGRMHQLRVHLQAIGCPILGDHKYGGSNTTAHGLGVEDRLHLHAWRIRLPGFSGGKPIDVTAPLPAHMKQSFKALGIDVPKP